MIIRTLSCLATAAALTVAAIAPASAQSMSRIGYGAAALAEGEVMIQAQRTISTRPAEGPDANRNEDAVRMIYKMAERECALVLETIGETCTLTSINTSVQSTEFPAGAPTLRTTGNFNMKVRLKK